MKRLTTHEIIAGQVHDITIFELQDCAGVEEIIKRLAAIEDILGEEYELDRLSVMINQCMTMREEVSERFSLTAKIPLDRLRVIMDSEQRGGLIVGYGPDDPGPKGPPGVCPSCGEYGRISWDPETDVSKCSNCGWSNGTALKARGQE